jgi:hypothetical protein
MSLDHSFSGTIFYSVNGNGRGRLASSGRHGRIDIIFPFLVEYRKNSLLLSRTVAIRCGRSNGRLLKLLF